MKPTVIDLFAGVGGLSLGFEMAGFDVVLANEYDPSIAEAYVKNRPNANMIVADITKLPVDETFGSYEGKVTAVIGGPPCQGFSQKGKRKSINDPRNFLFRYYYEVVKKVKPKYFVIENVPNLLTTENGLFKDEIIELFNGIGYAVSCEVPQTSACHKTDTGRASSASSVQVRRSPFPHRMECTQRYGMLSVTLAILNLEKGLKSRVTEMRR